MGRRAYLAENVASPFVSALPPTSRTSEDLSVILRHRFTHPRPWVGATLGLARQTMADEAVVLLTGLSVDIGRWQAQRTSRETPKFASSTCSPPPMLR